MTFDLGRRSWFLILFGLAYLGIGYGQYIQPTPIGRPRLFAHEFIPVWVRAVIWISGAIIGFIGALNRNKPLIETVGFLGLILPMSVQSVSFGLGLISAIFYPDYRHLLLMTGSTGFFVYGVVVAAIMIVASWPEPHPEFLRETLHYKPEDFGS